MVFYRLSSSWTPDLLSLSAHNFFDSFDSSWEISIYRGLEMTSAIYSHYFGFVIPGAECKTCLWIGFYHHFKAVVFLILQSLLKNLEVVQIQDFS